MTKDATDITAKSETPVIENAVTNLRIGFRRPVRVQDLPPVPVGDVPPDYIGDVPKRGPRFRPPTRITDKPRRPVRVEDGVAVGAEVEAPEFTIMKRPEADKSDDIDRTRILDLYVNPTGSGERSR